MASGGKFRIQIRQLLGITVIWTIVWALDALNTEALAKSEYIQRTAADSFWRFFLVNSLAATVAGLVSGSILVFWLREQMRTRSFGFALLVNTVVISLLNFGFTILAYDLFLTVSPDLSILDPSLELPASIVSSTSYLKIIVLWVLLVLMTLIMLNVNEKYGPGIFRQLLLGRYHRPREEERIFLFVDMKSSTAIAERLGHIRFFNLLNDFYRDITGPIINTDGEIYQYVGDEIVISWTMSKGVQNANCIRCFYQIQETIQKLSDRYQEKYGLVPEFKGGLHSGLVTVGEIGVIKKDIVFSGDVMNTTHRIQSICNKFRVAILISKKLLDVLQLPPHQYFPKRVGVIELKGKKEKVELYTFEQSLDSGRMPRSSLLSPGKL